MNSTKPEIRSLATHERIRQEILDGHLKPGERLQPAMLAERYGTSTTVVREALTRLAGAKMLNLAPNRGFFIPRLDIESFRDITELRCRIEGMGIELAVARGDLAWESQVVAAHHQLARTPRRGVDDPKHVANTWAIAHRAFHAKLLEACGMPLIVGWSRQLSDSTELYRRWAAPSSAASARDVETEHAEIVKATVQRDALRASELLRLHYEQTLAVVAQSGLVDGVGAP